MTFRAAAISVAVILLAAVPAGASCKIVLTNGNTIMVNSYRIDGGRVYLKYPVGEAAFPAKDIKSIINGEGKAEMLQVEGVLKPASAAPAPVQPGARPTPLPPVGIANPIGKAPAAQPPAPAVAPQAGVPPGGAANAQAKTQSDDNYDPDLSDLVEEYSSTDDEAKQAEIEKKLFGDDDAE